MISERVNFQPSISNDTETASDQCQNKEGFDDQCRNWKKMIPGVCSDKFMMDKCKGTCHEKCGTELQIFVFINFCKRTKHKLICSYYFSFFFSIITRVWHKVSRECSRSSVHLSWNSNNQACQ